MWHGHKPLRLSPPNAHEGDYSEVRDRPWISDDLPSEFGDAGLASVACLGYYAGPGLTAVLFLNDLLIVRAIRKSIRQAGLMTLDRNVPNVQGPCLSAVNPVLCKPFSDNRINLDIGRCEVLYDTSPLSPAHKEPCKLS